MKTLTDYIKESLLSNKNLNNEGVNLENISEALDELKIRDLIVKYDCPKDLYIQVPEKYGESDIQIYLDDTLLPKLPAETQENALGKNFKEISDCFFEYDSMEPAGGVGQNSDIEWDDSYDSAASGSNMIVQHIKNLRYVIKFDHFYLEKVDDDEIKETIYKLFNGFTTDADEELPFEITLDEDKGIEYKK